MTSEHCASLEQGKGGWYWVDGYATSQDFPTEAEARAAMADEHAALIAAGLDLHGLASAGIIEWTY